MRLFLFIIILLLVGPLTAHAQLQGSDTSPGDSCAGFPEGAARMTASPAQDGSHITLICDGSVWNKSSDYSDSLWFQSGSDIYYNSGNVGIGTAAPGGTLHISTNNPLGMLHVSSPFSGPDRDPEIVFENTGSTATFRRVSINFHHSNGKGAEIEAYRESGNDDGMDLRFFTQPIGASLQQRMVIKNDGLVGIGKTDPSAALDVVGDIHYTGIISDVSDRRKKDDIRIIGRPLERIGKLHGVSFAMKDSGGKRELGLIAQDVAPVFPELVVTLPDGTLALNYQGMTGPLVEAVKELHAQNIALAADNAELRRMLHSLSARMDVLEGKARPPLRPYNQ